LSDREQQIGSQDSIHRILDDSRHERLAEGDGVAFEQSIAVTACRIFFAGANTIQRFLHGAFPSAAQTHHVVYRSVNFDHARGRVAGALVQAVDVLCD
jgi:hypothetical protein